jgi:putative ABC transport system permease protein
MRSLPVLAWYYLSYYKGRTVILLVCLTVAFSFPVTVHRLVGLLQGEMVGRADATPLVIGTRGSRVDLVLHALYFHTAAPGIVRQAERFAIEESGYATTLPILARHRARGHRVVGTTAAYLPFRGLELLAGRPPGMFGDCVLGWQAARTLGLKPGDRLLTDSENVFDLAGARPLDLRVTGVLQQAHSQDDYVVFVELETAWIIAGIGHGHDAPDAGIGDIADSGVGTVTPAVSPPVHTRITLENLASFHFHGDPSDYPLTAIIAIPPDARSRSLLLGRYVAEDSPIQALRPIVVIEELLGMIVQLKRFFDVHHVVLLAVTSLFVCLVMLLSLRLRRREIQTLVHLGCSRPMLVALQATELSILLAASAVLAAGISALATIAATGWIHTLAGGG